MVWGVCYHKQLPTIRFFLLFTQKTILLPPLSADVGVSPEAVAEAYHAFERGENAAPLTAAALSNQTIQESMRLLLLVRAYQVRRRREGGREGGHGNGAQHSTPPAHRLHTAPASLQTPRSSRHSRLPPPPPPPQVMGHYAANLDPLGLDQRPPPAELDPAFYGFGEADLDRE